MLDSGLGQPEQDALSTPHLPQVLGQFTFDPAIQMPATADCPTRLLLQRPGAQVLPAGHRALADGTQTWNRHGAIVNVVLARPSPTEGHDMPRPITWIDGLRVERFVVAQVERGPQARCAGFRGRGAADRLRGRAERP